MRTIELNDGWVNIPMEKRTPHCKLSVVKTIASTGNVRTTQQARLGAVAMGLTFSDMLEVVMSLQTSEFHKSMTTPIRITPYGKTSIARHQKWGWCISS
jgi:hypothetical protein